VILFFPSFCQYCLPAAAWQLGSSTHNTCTLLLRVKCTRNCLHRHFLFPVDFEESPCPKPGPLQNWCSFPTIGQWVSPTAPDSATAATGKEKRREIERPLPSARHQRPQTSLPPVRYEKCLKGLQKSRRRRVSSSLLLSLLHAPFTRCTFTSRVFRFKNHVSQHAALHRPQVQRRRQQQQFPMLQNRLKQTAAKTQRHSGGGGDGRILQILQRKLSEKESDKEERR
jgi:hypothetical protein